MYLRQLDSSSPSEQSTVVSQTLAFSIQVPSLQWTLGAVHSRSGRLLFYLLILRLLFYAKNKCLRQLTSSSPSGQSSVVSQTLAFSIHVPSLQWTLGAVHAKNGSELFKMLVFAIACYAKQKSLRQLFSSSPSGQSAVVSQTLAFSMHVPSLQ